MVNNKYFSSHTVLLSSVSYAILTTVQPGLRAEDSSKIAELAQEATVQINNSLNNQASPGGSGVIIDKSGDTYTVLTANHVVCDGPPGEQIICANDISYNVRTYDGQEYLLKNIENIPQNQNDTDVALGSFESKEDYPVVQIGDSDQAVLGSDIYVAGFPTTFNKIGSDRDFSFTRGAVASRPNNIAKGYDLVYDARTKIGMSGGPVFDVKSRLIGIHGRGDGKKLETGEDTFDVKSGFNAAIPINVFKTSCSQITTCPEVTVDNTKTGIDPAASFNNPQTARDYYKKGLSAQARNIPQEAIANYNKALALNPDNDTKFLVYFNLGYVQLLNQQWQTAIDNYDQAIAIEANDARAFSERADAYKGLENFTSAISDYSQAISLDPNFADAYNNRAFVYNRQSNFEAAESDLNKAAQLYLSQGREYEHQLVKNNLIRVRNNRNNSATPVNPFGPLNPPTNPTPGDKPIVNPNLDPVPTVEQTPPGNQPIINPNLDPVPTPVPNSSGDGPI